MSTHIPPNLLLRPEISGDSVMLFCSGRLTIETFAKLRDEVRSLMFQKKHLTLDLRDVAHMDSSGLGVLVSIYVSSKRDGWDFRLVNSSDPIRRLLSLSNLVSLFEACGRAGTRMS